MIRLERQNIRWNLIGNITSPEKRICGSLPRRSGATRTEMVMLVQKVDERRRTIDPNGTSKLYNEYYELIFKTRKGEILHIVTTKVVYKEVPFNQQGSLTFRGEQFVKFKYLGGEITEAKTHYNAEVINK